MEHIMGSMKLTGCPHITSDRLQQSGFTSDVITRVDTSMPDVFGIRGAFAPSILGEEFCMDALGMSEDEKHRRMRALRRVVAGRDVFRWASDILEGLAAPTSWPPRPR